MKGKTTPGFSRREFLVGASALGGVALASAAPAQITTMAPFEKLPPYGNNTLPARSQTAPRAERQWPHREHDRGRDAGPAPGAAAPRFSEPGLQLAQGDAGDRGRWLLRDCSGLPRVWPHGWLGQILGRGPRAVPDAQHGARPDRARLCARLSQGRDGCRARSGSAHRHVCRNRPARHVSPSHDGLLGGRRTAIVPLRGSGTKARVHRRGARRGVREAQSAAARLSGLLGQQAGRRGHEARASGHERFFPRVLLHEGRRISRQPEPDALAADADRQRGRAKRMRGCRSTT